MAGTLTPCAFRDGEVLLREGDPGDHLYLLESGEVQVQVAGPPAFERRVLAPATLGEMALITDAPRTATVRAVGSVRGLRLDRGRLEALLVQHPPIARVLTRLVGDRLREIDGIRRVGKYVITGVLGRGGVAEVFSARHPELGLPVALKMLSHAVVHHPQFAAAFDEEARVIAGLQHPNVVRVYDTERAYGTRFIVMEQLEGHLLEEVRRPRPPWEVLRRVLAEITRALAHVHAHGLVHRDVKPEHIFLTAAGPARLLDFGIAISAQRSACAGAQRLGTPFYMAPEQIRGLPLDGRTDLYALGITAYEVATGRLPFLGRDLPELLRHQLHTPTPPLRDRAPDAPGWLVRFVERATAKDPADRFADAEAALACLRDGEGAGRVVRYAVEDAPAVEAALARLQAELAAAGVEIEVGE
ncbi:MAG: protein kinase [bacterium]